MNTPARQRRWHAAFTREEIQGLVRMQDWRSVVTLGVDWGLIVADVCLLSVESLGVGLQEHHRIWLEQRGIIAERERELRAQAQAWEVGGIEGLQELGPPDRHRRILGLLLRLLRRTRVLVGGEVGPVGRDGAGEDDKTWMTDGTGKGMGWRG